MIGGRLDVMCPSPASSLVMARDGRLRGYAVTSSARLTSAPDIATVDEAGFPELQISVWGGVFAPKGTPKTVVDKLNAALVEALADPAVRQKFTDLGQEIFPRERQTPAALAALQKAEIEKWWPIIKAANVKAD
jgi:tripartite-type tricarboxylate transporter receptor subunit TctC